MFTRNLFLVICLAVALGSPLSAQDLAEVFLTAKNTKERLSSKGELKFVSSAQPDEHSATVFVDPDHAFQSIVGIGGALTDASAETFAALSPEKQKEFITRCYDPVNGIGYTLGRTNINSCDFSSGSYAYTEAEDKTLKTFDVEHDRKFRLPFIRLALEQAPDLKLFASPWSPPAWMKSNGNMLQGGKLKPDWAAAWALYYARFVQAYEKEGVPIWGLTVQNEPMATQTWESCIYTAEEERDFVVDHLGPTLEKEGLSELKLMIWDHNRGLIYQRASTLYDDPEAARYVWGTAYHWYDGARADNVGMVHEAYPDKALLFSEGCNYPFSWDTFEDWGWGENYGRAMIDDFNNWANGWTDWNVLLDSKGGPNHVANYCFAPVHADDKGELHYMNSFYYIGHFSKFVRPGARRVACTTTRSTLRATAFLNPDGKVATVMMNDTAEAMKAAVWHNGKSVPVELPANSIATVVWSN